MGKKFLLFKNAFAFAALSVIILMAPADIYAQAKVVSGTVEGPTGEMLPGVSVVEKGTANGTVTDIDGKFRLTLSESNTIVLSYIGMATQEIPVGNQSTFRVVMEEDAQHLQEIVVVDYGYGTVKKTDMTGSVASLSGEELRKVPVANAAEAISGRLPGVNVLATDGSPDAEVVIRVRGGGSVTQDNSPIYVVDGFIVSSIRDIPPTDILSIDVLKDASATAIYGARGANGVIVINTKKPKAGKTTISYNGFAQFKHLPRDRRYEVLSPHEYVMANYEYAKLRSETDLRNFERFFGKYDDLELYQYKRPTDWQEELFGDPQTSQYHNLSISGGTEKTKLSLSLTNNDDQGLLVGSGYQRNVINFKLNHEISDALQFDVSTRITNTVINGAGTSGSSQLRIKDAITTRPVNGIADELEIDMTNVDEQDEFQQFLLRQIDPRELAEHDWRKRTTNTYVLNGGLTWSILDNLDFRSVFTTQNRFDERLRYYGPLTSESKQEGSSLPLGTMQDSKSWSYRWFNTVKYDFTDLGNHKFDVLLGQEVQSNGGNSSFVRAEDFRFSMGPEEMFANMVLGNTVEHRTAQSTETNMFSLFGRLNYMFDDKYIITGTFRRDASSKFAKDLRVGYFPAVAVGWKISEEGFMSGLDAVDQLKLRISYGATGNDRIDDNAMKFLFAASSNNGPGMGTNDYNTYYSPSGDVLYNPDLIWETTINRNAGLDFSLFKAKVVGNLDVYYNTTKDLLLKSAISPTSGFNTQWNNIGSTSNKGIELGLNAYIVDKNDFSFSTVFNFGINRAKIEELDGTNDRFFQSNWASTDLKDRDDYYLQVGGTIGDIYGYVTEGMYTTDDFEGYDETAGEYVLKEGVYDNSQTLGVNNLKPGYLKLKDLNEDGEINSLDRRVIGNALPKAQGGFGFNTRFKNFDASIFFNWSYGNDVYNTGKIEFNQFYRSAYGNMLNSMNSDNRFTYIDVDGQYTGMPGEVVTDLDQLADMNQGKEMWSHTSFGLATAVIHDWAVEDGSFIRLNTLTLGYSLPQSIISKVKLSQFRIYATGYNLALFTNYSGYDPEVSTTRSSTYSLLTPGVDYSSYPRSRSFTVGVNVTF